MIIPTIQIPINTPSNLGFIAFLNMIMDDKLNVVTPIIKESTAKGWCQAPSF